MRAIPNTAQNELIKAGQTPPEWKKQPRKLSQKDLDGRWAKKNHETFYGYKNQLRADAESKIITDFTVTDAAVHDSQSLPKLIGPQNRDETLFADSAYKRAKTDALLAQWGLINNVQEKGARNRPLTKLQQELNRLKSQIRCRIEHIFGFVENTMGGPELEYIGRPRIHTGVGLSNLAYNFLRHVQLIRLGREPAHAYCGHLAESEAGRFGSPVKTNFSAAHRAAVSGRTIFLRFKIAPAKPKVDCSKCPIVLRRSRTVWSFR